MHVVSSPGVGSCLETRGVPGWQSWLGTLNSRLGATTVSYQQAIIYSQDQQQLTLALNC